MVVWSYSLYGFNTEVYYRPMLENIRLAKLNNAQIIIGTTDLYADEIKRFFNSFLDDIHIKVYPANMYTGCEMILRLLVAETVDAEFYFIKDADSIVTPRELYVMNHWMHLSKENFMIIRDNPVHISPIMAGMFGFRRSVSHVLLNSCRSHFTGSGKKGNYGVDQRWLAEEIYPLTQKDANVYTSYFYFSHEKVISMSRELNPVAFIGAPSHGNINPNSMEQYFKRFYGRGLMHLPYLFFLPRSLSRLIYGRVRPTMYIAAFIKWFKD